MLQTGDKVRINIPLQAAYVKNAAQKRDFNHRTATIVKEIGSHRFILDVDGGRFEWAESLLANAMPKM